MRPFDSFTTLVQALMRQWGLVIEQPLKECTVRFNWGLQGETALRLSDDERTIMLGTYLSLSALSAVPIDRQALQVFLLQRTFAARFSSQVRYAWLREDDRIGQFCGIALDDANLEKINSELNDMHARFDVLSQVLPLFEKIKDVSQSNSLIHV